MHAISLCPPTHQNKIDVREEPPEQMAARFLELLRVLKYRPDTSGGSATDFRTKLIEGDRDTVCAILAWVLQRFDKLKTRAFLGRFLVPIEVISAVHVCMRACGCVLFVVCTVWALSMCSEWLLTRVTRVLFLQVPPEFQSDSFIRDQLEHHHQLMEEFKETHKQLVDARGHGASASVVRGDIKSMEEEKQLLVRRLEREKKKVGKCVCVCVWCFV